MVFNSDIKKFLIGFAACLLVLLFFAGCKKEAIESKPAGVEPYVQDEPAAPPEEPKEEEKIAYVKIHKFSFEPDVLNITMGTTVTWENADDYPHRIMTPQSGFQSPTLKPGETFKRGFYTADESYKYVEPGFGSIGYINVKY